MINIRRAVSTAAVTAATVGAVGTLGAATAWAAPHPAATVNDIHVTAKKVGNSSAGHSYVRLVYTNTGKHTVSIKGYSGVWFVAYGNGTRVGRPATWLHDHRARSVVLRPGRHTRELVSIADPGLYGSTEHHTVTADGFRVYLPGENRALFAPFRAEATTRDVSQLAVEPVGVGNQL